MKRVKIFIFDTYKLSIVRIKQNETFSLNKSVYLKCQKIHHQHHYSIKIRGVPRGVRHHHPQSPLYIRTIYPIHTPR